MSDQSGLICDVQSANELGVVICKVCNEVVHTLPTNGVKKISGVCDKHECREQLERREVRGE